MSTESATFDSTRLAAGPPSHLAGTPWSTMAAVLKPIASLKLTVTLFAFSIVLVLAGTLAQYDMNMWEVIRVYFRSLIVRVDFQVFFPPSLFRSAPQVPGFLFLPGGKALGMALFANLAAAHLLRFKVQSQGRRRWIGLAFCVVGVLMTTLIILRGQNPDGLQGRSIVSWNVIWNLIRCSVVAAWIGVVALLVRVDRRRKVEFIGLVAAAVGLGCLAFFLIARGDSVRLGDSSLRIMWQLIQGGLAALVLLAGCVLVFKKRGGIVLIHVGVGLLMLGELLVGVGVVEEKMTLGEGETSTFTRDIREVELAIVDRSQPDEDVVVAIPGSLLRSPQIVDDHQLPFRVETVSYQTNSQLRKRTAADQDPATAGAMGKIWISESVKPVGGADAGNATDVASAYIRLLPKSDDESDDESESSSPASDPVYLVSQYFGDCDFLLPSPKPPVPESVQWEGKTYDLFLRYRRNYSKPYRITLEDVRKNDYLGTNTPQDYSSWIRLEDPSRDFVRDRIRIWMNNPLRYAGETFYQSGYAVRPDGTEVTTLQIVKNTGWMIPYVACMLVATGMLFHFSQTLLRFLAKRSRTATQKATQATAANSGKKATGKRGQRQGAQPEGSGSSGWLAPEFIVPAVITSILAVYVLGKADPKAVEYQGMRLDRFGEMPIVYGGRVKPIDTLARNTMRILSNRQTFDWAEGGDYENGEVIKTDATLWLLNVMSMSEDAELARVFRIDDPAVQATLGLDWRKHFRYSAKEIRANMDEFTKQVAEARKLLQADASALSSYQRKLLETDRRFSVYAKLRASFEPLPFPPVPSEEDREKNPEQAKAAIDRIANLAAATPQWNERLMAQELPLTVPLARKDSAWLPFAAAANAAYVKKIFSGDSPDPRLIRMTEIIDSFSRSDAKGLNRAVTGYLKSLRANPPEGYQPKKVRFESYFNHLQPFTIAMALYIIAFLLTAASWIGWFQPLRRSASWVIFLAFAVHTFALVGRIVISGRPPITNLYSSAVFIGWGCVVLAMLVELLHKLGIGNIVASVTGFATLVIAHLLAFGGDTFTVLQAVLDTQFWLATHVVCISLGYATTFVAGAFATIYIVGRFLPNQFDKDDQHALARIVYGVVCFAMFFSFVGTVLGGLWADDSWGRFWGWDPKENGALMIVLWNAMILHARWGGMVRDRGVAVLAVLGNIVTSWSWFGVNELGIGLHSYGFTDGVVPALACFAASQLVVAGLAWIPARSRTAVA